VILPLSLLFSPNGGLSVLSSIGEIDKNKVGTKVVIKNMLVKKEV
jgi:hypothetical protein